MVKKDPSEGAHAVGVGSSIWVFVLTEAILFVFMDIEWALRKRNSKQMGKGVKKRKHGRRKRKKHISVNAK